MPNHWQNKPQRVAELKLNKHSTAYTTGHDQKSIYHCYLEYVGSSTHLKTSIRRNTTASKPAAWRISSSVNCHAFTIQVGEGTNRSKVNGSWSLLCSWASLRPKYTFTFPGCFRKTEYSDKNSKHRPMFMPADVSRAEISISVSSYPSTSPTICRVNDSAMQFLTNPLKNESPAIYAKNELSCSLKLYRPSQVKKSHFAA